MRLGIGFEINFASNYNYFGLQSPGCVISNFTNISLNFEKMFKMSLQLDIK